MSLDQITYAVTPGDGVVSVTRRGRREPIVATVLGQEVLPDGRVTYWLDRLVHAGGFRQLNDDWEARGAISSILTGPQLLHRE